MMGLLGELWLRLTQERPINMERLGAKTVWRPTRMRDQVDALSKAETVVEPGVLTEPIDDPFEQDETASVELSVSDDLAEYLKDNLTAFEQAISKAMALQIIHGWGMKEAVREAMREVTT